MHCHIRKDLIAMTLLFVTVILISLSGISMSAVYRVGDSAGWTLIDLPDYRRWASTNRFHVGDTLIFTYHKQYHDVMEVSHEDYAHCYTNSAKAFYHSGNDSIHLTKPGDFYFICSNDGHCVAGQKLHIKVHRIKHPSTLLVNTPTPSPPSLSTKDDEASFPMSLSPIVISAADTHPSSNNAAILKDFCLTIPTVLALGTYFYSLIMDIIYICVALEDLN